MRISYPGGGAGLSALGAWGLACAHLAQVTDGARYVLVLHLGIGVLALLTAVRLWCRTCFEARLMAGLLSATTALGVLLAVTVGAPGQPPRALAAPDWLALAAAVAMVVGVVVDRVGTSAAAGDTAH